MCPLCVLTALPPPLSPQVRTAQQAMFIKGPGDPIPEEVTQEDDACTLGAIGLQVWGQRGGRAWGQPSWVAVDCCTWFCTR